MECQRERKRLETVDLLVFWVPGVHILEKKKDKLSYFLILLNKTTALQGVVILMKLLSIR